jgi:hypothetical protein
MRQDRHVSLFGVLYLGGRAEAPVVAMQLRLELLRKGKLDGAGEQGVCRAHYRGRRGGH